MVKRMCWVLVYCGMTACGDLEVKGLVASSSADVESRFRESVYWNEGHEPIRLYVPSDEYRFYVCGDIHVEQETGLFTDFLRAAQEDGKSAFSLVLGDFIRGKDVFPLVADALSEFRSSTAHPDTMFATVGNHDLLFGQWKEYRHYLGVSSYFFEVVTAGGKDLFVSLDSGSGSLGISQLKWFSNLLASKRTEYRHAIVFTHVNLFKTGNAHTSSGNLPTEEVYLLTELCSKYRVALFLQGHDHIRGELCFKGVTYVVLDALLNDAPHSSYCVVTSGEKVSWQFVDATSEPTI